MAENVFRFKRFEVRNLKSAMKVNTDGVLLGAWAGVRPSDKIVLDAGTGTGTIALMIAQRLSDIGPADRRTFDITGIDIDEASVTEASGNFATSPWAESLTATHISLQDFQTEKAIDLIVSNPPYFDDSLQNPDIRKNAARHTSDGNMSYKMLVDFALKHLAPDGRLSMILPSDREKDLLRYGISHGLYPSRITRIRTVERKAPARILAEFTRNRQPEGPEEDILTINESGKHTSQYISLIKDFYLFA